MRVAIHQPNFIPWYPFFQKMASVDVFVLLSWCQFEKGKYQNRFRLDDQWYTMSVNHGLEPIIDKKYVDMVRDWDRIKSRLPKYRDILECFDGYITSSLRHTNSMIIYEMAGWLEIFAPRLEHDFETQAKGTDRLVEICKRHKATTYVAGQSGNNYLELDKFAAAGIEVEFQDLANADKRHSLEVLYERETLRKSNSKL